MAAPGHSLSKRIREAIKERLEDALAGNSLNFYLRKQGPARNLTLPAVMIVPLRPVRTPRSNTHDTYVYPVIAQLIKKNIDTAASPTDQLEFEDDVFERMLEEMTFAFQITPTDSPLASVSEVFNIEVVPGPVYELAELQNGRDVGTITINVSALVRRGLAA